MNFDVMNLVVDSNDFTAGGGSASAIAGGMAAGLAGMVARLTAKKPTHYTQAEYLDMADKLDKLAESLIDGAQKDTEAYLLIKNAYALPKETDEQKASRKEAISLAGIKAAEVPRNNAQLCSEVLGIAKSLQGRSNASAGTDLSAALMLAEVGVKGCLLNVEVNLAIISDEAAVESFKRDIKDLSKH